METPEYAAPSNGLVPLTPLPSMPFPDEPPPEMLLGLSLREQRFVIRYLEHGKLAQAWREAGYLADTPPGAKQQEVYKLQGDGARRIVQQPRIQAAIARLQAWYAYHAGIHAWQVLGALQKLAFLDPVEIYEDDGQTWKLKPMAEWPLHLRQAIQKVRIREWDVEGGTRREIDVEFPDREHALFLIGKHLKLFEKKDKQLAPFTLVLNTKAPEATEKPVGQVIEGIGLQIQLPDP